jgi:basic amino acid/polyamine antiporter, APA family
MIIIGVVVGAGIFMFPVWVAGQTSSPGMFLGFWVLGGVISLIGALCYAELASAYPSAGGDYHFLSRAFGRNVSYLFAWARMTVIQTGAIAMVAFLIGEYASRIYSFGLYSDSIYAMLVIALLTGTNAAGLRQGKWAQYALTGATVLGLLLVAIAGLFLADPPPAPPVAEGTPLITGSFGMALVFVLLTYGGWNEAAYLSAEVRNGKYAIAKALFVGIGIITVIYLIANWAYLRGLGLSGVSESKAIAADLLGSTVGAWGAIAVTVLVLVAALSTTNATIITGARTNYAFGKDFAPLKFLGRWSSDRNTPIAALLFQGAIAAGLIVLGTLIPRTGFEAMVDYTAPVFWFFFLLVGLSVFILRRWEPDRPRPFRIPLYPLTPFVFCGVCLYMFFSSVSYAASLEGRGAAAFIGLGVVAAGVALIMMAKPSEQAIDPRPEQPEER